MTNNSELEKIKFYCIHCGKPLTLMGELDSKDSNKIIQNVKVNPEKKEYKLMETIEITHNNCKMFKIRFYDNQKVEIFYEKSEELKFHCIYCGKTLKRMGELDSKDPNWIIQNMKVNPEKKEYDSIETVEITHNNCDMFKIWFIDQNKVKIKDENERLKQIKTIFNFEKIDLSTNSFLIWALKTDRLSLSNLAHAYLEISRILYDLLNDYSIKEKPKDQIHILDLGFRDLLKLVQKIQEKQTSYEGIDKKDLPNAKESVWSNKRNLFDSLNFYDSIKQNLLAERSNKNAHNLAKKAILISMFSIIVSGIITILIAIIKPCC